MTEEAGDERSRMHEVDHTHPHTDAPFGDNGVYDRGPEDETAEDDDDRSDDGGVPVRTDGGSDGGPVQPEWAVQRAPTDRDR